MSDYTASCDAVQVDDRGGLYSLAVFSDGEGFNSFVYFSTDVAARGAPNVQSQLLDVRVWLTDLLLRPDGRLYCSDSDGNVRSFDGGGWAISPVSERALTCVWAGRSTAVYAAGDDGIVYRLDGGVWAAISPPLGDTIFAIRGLSDHDIYACGAGALFWHYDGRGWRRIELPTNQRLLGLLALTAEDVLVCGRGGVLYRGAGDSWADISQPGHHFHAAAAFNGTVHLAGAGEGIFQLKDGTLSNIKGNITSYKLATSPSYLASSGDNLAARFDGQGWFGTRFT